MIGIIFYRAKVISVIHHEFNYKPAVPGWQSPVFNDITRQVRKMGGNEYDGATAFMLTLANSMPEEGVDGQAESFKSDIFLHAAAIIPLGKLGDWIENN